MQAEMAQQPERLAALIARADEVAGLVQRPSAGTAIVPAGPPTTPRSTGAI